MIIGLRQIDSSRLTNDQERAHSFDHHTSVFRMSNHGLREMAGVPVRYGSRNDTQFRVTSRAAFVTSGSLKLFVFSPVL